MFLQTANKLVRNYSTDIGDGRHRGYYMATRRYKISLLVSECSEQVKYFFQHKKRNFVSPSDHVMFYYLLYKHQ